LDIEIGLVYKDKDGKRGTVIDLLYGEEAELVVWFDEEKEERKFLMSSVNENDLSYYDGDLIIQTSEYCTDYRQFVCSVRKGSKSCVILVAGLKVYNPIYGFGRIKSLYKNYISAVPTSAMEIQFEDRTVCFSLPCNIWRYDLDPMDIGASMQFGGIFIVSNLAPYKVRYNEQKAKKGSKTK